jgi:hypothetical protein
MKLAEFEDASPNMVIDGEGEPFIFHYTVNNYYEKYAIPMITVPICANFILDGERDVYLALGVQLNFPFRENWRARASELTTWGDYSAVHGDSHVGQPNFAGFGTWNDVSGRGLFSLKSSMSITAEFGKRYNLQRLSRQADELDHRFPVLYVGVYVKYGITNMRFLGNNNSPINYRSGTVQYPVEDYLIDNCVAAATNFRGKNFSARTVPIEFGATLRITINLRSYKIFSTRVEVMKDQ